MGVRAEVSPQGVGIFGLLGLLFVGLKLAGCIDWSWWWMLAPFWGPPLLVAALLAIVALVALSIAAMSR